MIHDAMNPENYLPIATIKRRKSQPDQLYITLHAPSPSAVSLSWIYLYVNQTFVPYQVTQCTIGADQQEGWLSLAEAPPSHYLTQGTLFLAKTDPFIQEALPEKTCIGYEVIDPTGKKLGTVQDVIPRAQQPIINVNYEGQELLIPYHPHFITQDDHQKQLHAHLPEGYLEALGFTT